MRILEEVLKWKSLVLECLSAVKTMRIVMAEMEKATMKICTR